LTHPHVRIVTYNIHQGRGLDRRVRIERILRVLLEIDADIVALQEVVNHPNQPPSAHQACFLAEQLKYSYTVGEVRRHRKTPFGNVTLSRWPIERAHHIDLSVLGRQKRGALRADIRVGQHLLHVFNVHLGTALRERRTQARLIDERLLKVLDVSGQRIVLGDFNDWNHGLVTRTLSAEFHLTDLAAHLPRTRAYPGILPLLHLDHIYLDHRLTIERAWFHRSRLALVASDHLPLVTDLRL
jgi:endonuclease/exonuclease/phosphatase family metal-dependent hydrolase